MKDLSLKFSQHLKVRGYLENIKEKVSVRRQLCLQTIDSYTYTKAFVITYHAAIKKLKQILMEHWSLLHNQPLLKKIFTKPQIIFYEKGKSLKDTLVRVKIEFEGDNATRSQQPRGEAKSVFLYFYFIGFSSYFKLAAGGPCVHENSFSRTLVIYGIIYSVNEFIVIFKCMSLFSLA